jgi:hypothetical protein
VYILGFVYLRIIFDENYLLERKKTVQRMGYKGAGKNGNTHLVRGGCGPLPASLAIRGEKILLATARVHGR